MTTYGSMDSAMRYAESKHLEYTDSRYANQNPCTTVYRLVRQLLGKDVILNVEIMSSVENSKESSPKQYIQSAESISATGTGGIS